MSDEPQQSEPIRPGAVGVTPDGARQFPCAKCGARLEYTMTLKTTGPVQVTAVLSPRNNVHPTDGLKYAISVDDQPPLGVGEPGHRR